MDKETLREHLARLHQEIADAHGDSPEARQSAENALRGIEDPTDGGVTERLETVAVRFEADHPTLAASARRLIDLLGEVGI